MTPQSQKDIPNLRAGYVHYSGKNRRDGYLTLDYILPIRLEANSIVFGHAHSEFQIASQKSSARFHDNVFLAMGGGYRSVLGGKIVVGVNGFCDLTQFGNEWLSSGGAGLEMAFLIHGHDALDMNFNWYGDLSDNDLVINEFRDGYANYELQVGYSHQLYHEGPDLRLYGAGYKFDDETGVWGWQAGVELKSPDGVLSLKGETAYDPVNESYQSVSAFVNLGFRIENLLRGKNPISVPERIFNSPRNFDRLTDKVKRNWQHTTHGVKRYALDSTSLNRKVTIWNKTGKQQKVYVKFSQTSYSMDHFKSEGWTVDGNILWALVDDGKSIPLNFNQPGNGISVLVISVGSTTAPTCQLTQAELTLQNNWGTVDKPNVHEGTDISLVNGFDYPVTIVAPYSQSQDLKPKAKPTDPNTFYGPTIKVAAATGNSKNYGVFGLGNDQCCASCVMPSGCCSQWTASTIKNESHPATTTPVQCPASPPPGTCDPSNPCYTYPCRGAQQCAPLIPCQANFWQTYATGTEWTVTFNKP
ncbi:hypothetical protein ACFL2Q_10055 [Thermodesulfobacteriota bacterium]